MSDGWWQELRAQLPLCAEHAYFFPGAQGPLSRDAEAAMRAAIDAWGQTASAIHDTEAHHQDDAARAVGELIGCGADRVALAANTSDALNMAAATVLTRWRLDGRPPANVVLHDESHAASTYGWLNAARLGEPLELRVATREHGEDPLEALARRIDERTLAVVTTHVSNWDGARLDLPGLAARYPDRRFALVADAAQSAGALPLAEIAAVCDFVGMPAYKFLLGAPGVGFLVLGARWLSDPGPPAPGWAGMRHPLPIVPFALDLEPTAAAYRTGIPNYIGLAGTAAGVNLLVRAGADRVGERVHEIADLVIERLADIGLGLTTPTDRAHRAGVLTVIHPDAPGAMRRLATHGVIVGVERNEIRVDVHAYNDAGDVDRLITGLSS